MRTSIRNIENAVDAVQAMGRGQVTNWDVMARTWEVFVNNEVFNRISSVAGQHRPFPDVMLTHGLHEDPQNREIAWEIMFEVLNCNATTSVSATRAALAHTGRTSGIVVECGDGTTQVNYGLESGLWLEDRRS